MTQENTESGTDRRLANLKPPWKPGQSGNPRGRAPKGYAISDMVREKLDDVPDILIRGRRNTKTWRELLAESMLVNAYQGRGQSMAVLLERTEGKVAQPLEVSVAPISERLAWSEMEDDDLERVVEIAEKYE